MSSKMKTGAQRSFKCSVCQPFVPTVEVDMWIETIIKDGKEILQSQYEQIVFLNLISEMMEELQAGLTSGSIHFVAGRYS